MNPQSNPKTVFITGVTGTLGKEFVKELLTTTNDRLYLLIRRKRLESHWARMRKILASEGLEVFLGTRVHVLEGDVTLPDMGLTQADLKLLRRDVREFYHIAALTTLNGSEEDCMQVNLGGTQEALRLAWDLRKNGVLERFFYFSTAFVAGSRQTYHAKEDELPEKPAHANFYESSKYQAESRVRLAMAEGLPVTIFRPSIVVGDSQTGEVSEFNVIYPFMKLFAHGILTKIPTHPENSFNIVPIDFVIRASCAIARRQDSIGKTYHLVTQEPPTIGNLLKVGGEYPRVPPIQVIRPEDFVKENLAVEEQMVFEMLEPYLGYLNDHLTFDTTNADRALEGTGISFPKTDYKFLKLIVQYAVEVGYLAVLSPEESEPAQDR